MVGGVHVGDELVEVLTCLWGAWEVDFCLGRWGFGVLGVPADGDYVFSAVVFVVIGVHG